MSANGREFPFRWDKLAETLITSGKVNLEA